MVSAWAVQYIALRKSEVWPFLKKESLFVKKMSCTTAKNKGAFMSLASSSTFRILPRMMCWLL
jgi:hypothetical protein